MEKPYTRDDVPVEKRALPQMQNMWSRINSGSRHFKAIVHGATQQNASRGILQKMFSRKKHIEHACISIANLVMVKQREMMAMELERYYVNRGILVDIELSGPEKSFLKLVCPLFHEASVYRIADDTNFFACLKEAGFKKVVFGDSEENAWSYRLEKL